ncbi:proteasome subunit beta type-3 [Tripterygium wilfordii]|uniref:Proteasome subunit beta type-3 n=1 Tax=Tripterygium wilfordii TaxID=458696 RepID=A0A7J7CN25_TRIWF|nr:proteasome subunit beta type-3 [Tripterygium wilfordii]
METHVVVCYHVNENVKSQHSLEKKCRVCTLGEPEELFEAISQALLSSVDRDCLSGWGGHVFVV